MVNYLAIGNKNVRCKCGCMNTVPLQKTIHKCPSCGMMSCVRFFGTIVDKNGNYIF